MKRLKRFAAVSAVTALGALAFGAGPAAAQNPKACHGQIVSNFTSNVGGGLGQVFGGQNVREIQQQARAFCQQQDGV